MEGHHVFPVAHPHRRAGVVLHNSDAQLWHARLHVGCAVVLCVPQDIVFLESVRGRRQVGMHGGPVFAKVVIGNVGSLFEEEGDFYAGCVVGSVSR